MLIFAHRGKLTGPADRDENTLPRISTALQQGFGIETDIRWTRQGKFYISHDADPEPAPPMASDHAELWRRYPRQPIALNVKELGYETELVAFLDAYRITEQVFLFDFELLEPTPGETARRYRNLHPTLKLAARISDRYGETIEQALGIECAEISWLDEFDSLWVEQRHIDRLKNIGKTVYAISPEIHGFPLDVAEQRWRQFAAWGVDGICTDWAIRARDVQGAGSGQQGADR